MLPGEDHALQSALACFCRPVSARQTGNGERQPFERRKDAGFWLSSNGGAIFEQFVEMPFCNIEESRSANSFGNLVQVASSRGGTDLQSLRTSPACRGRFLVKYPIAKPASNRNLNMTMKLNSSHLVYGVSLFAGILLACASLPAAESPDRIQPWSKSPRYWQHKGQPVSAVGRQQGRQPVSDTRPQRASRMR
jgi:hypothetical protein